MGIINLLLRGGRGQVEDPTLSERRLTTPAGWTGNGSPRHPIAYEETFAWPTTFETTTVVAGALIVDFVGQTTVPNAFLQVFKNGVLSFVLNVPPTSPGSPYNQYRVNPADSSAFSISFAEGDVIRFEPDAATTILSLRSWIRRL